MNLIEAIEINLDKPRKLLINHMTLFRAEAEVNKLRFAKPEDYASIDVLMIEAFNHLFRSRGMLPLDLLLSMLCHGLVYEGKERRLSIEDIASLLDKTESSRAEISGLVWAAYYKVASKNLKPIDEAQPEEKKTEGQPTGKPNGVLHESS